MQSCKTLQISACIKKNRRQVTITVNGNMPALQHAITKRWNLSEKQPNCKKVCAPRRPLGKKMWNPRWQPRNGCDSRLIAKILITIIQLNLLPNPSETCRRLYKFTWIVVIIIFAIKVTVYIPSSCRTNFLLRNWGGLGCCCVVFQLVLSLNCWENNSTDWR